MGMSYWQWTWRLMFKLTNLTCLRSNHVSCKFCFVVDFLLTCLSQALCTMANLYMFSVIYHTLKCFFFMFQSGEHLKPFSSQYWRDYCLPLVLDLYLTLPNMGCTFVFDGSLWGFCFCIWFVLFFDPGPEEIIYIYTMSFKAWTQRSRFWCFGLFESICVIYLRCFQITTDHLIWHLNGDWKKYRQKSN